MPLVFDTYSLPCACAVKLAIIAYVRSKQLLHHLTMLVSHRHNKRSLGCARKQERMGANCQDFNICCTALLYTLGWGASLCGMWPAWHHASATTISQPVNLRNSKFLQKMEQLVPNRWAACVTASAATRTRVVGTAAGLACTLLSRRATRDHRRASHEGDGSWLAPALALALFPDVAAQHGCMCSAQTVKRDWLETLTLLTVSRRTLFEATQANPLH